MMRAAAGCCACPSPRLHCPQPAAGAYVALQLGVFDGRSPVSLIVFSPYPVLPCCVGGGRTRCPQPPLCLWPRGRGGVDDRDCHSGHFRDARRGSWPCDECGVGWAREGAPPLWQGRRAGRGCALVGTSQWTHVPCGVDAMAGRMWRGAGARAARFCAARDGLCARRGERGGGGGA